MLENISPFDAKCNLSSKKQTPPTRYDPPYRILSSELTLMLPLSLPYLTPGSTLESTWLEWFRLNWGAHLVPAMIDSSKKKRRRKYYLLLYYNEAVLQSKLIRLPKVRNGECSATTVTSLDGCIFDTFVCHTYQMALSKYAFGMLLLYYYFTILPLGT